jgi:hypothetical protein
MHGSPLAACIFAVAAIRRHICAVKHDNSSAIPEGRFRDPQGRRVGLRDDDHLTAAAT